MLVPEVQVVPCGWNAVSVQDGAPAGLHAMAAAVAQGFVLVQATPGVQRTQEPVELHWPTLVPEVQVVPGG